MASRRSLLRAVKGPFSVRVRMRLRKTLPVLNAAYICGGTGTVLGPMWQHRSEVFGLHLPVQADMETLPNGKAWDFGPHNCWFESSCLCQPQGRTMRLRRVRRFRCKRSGIWAPWVLCAVFPGKDDPFSPRTESLRQVDRNSTTTDVQHLAEGTPHKWTALQRTATPARASVDVRNETAKGDYAGGDSRDRPAYMAV